MRKTETVKQLAASANARHLDDLGQQIEALRQARLASAEQLASMLEPIAQAMAALTDETRQTLGTIEVKGQEQSARINAQILAAARVCQEAADRAERSADHLERAGNSLELNHYLMALATGCVTALLVSGFWLWLAPPIVQNHLDAQAVAEYLRPAIAALKPSKGK